MTTIAAKVEGEIITMSADSAVTAGWTDHSKFIGNGNSIAKILIGEDFIVGCAGALSTALGIEDYIKTMPIGGADTTYIEISNYFKELSEYLGKTFNNISIYSGVLLIAHKSGLYEINTGNVIPLNSYMAIGSGESFAMASMMSGATTEKAVYVASELDIFTGGDVKSIAFNMTTGKVELPDIKIPEFHRMISNDLNLNVVTEESLNDELLTEESLVDSISDMLDAVKNMPILKFLNDKDPLLANDRALKSMLDSTNYLIMGKLLVMKPVGLNVYMDDYVRLTSVQVDHLINAFKNMTEVRDILVDLRSTDNIDKYKIKYPDMKRYKDGMALLSSQFFDMFVNDYSEKCKFSDLYRSNKNTLETSRELAKLQDKFRTEINIDAITDVTNGVYALTREILDRIDHKSKGAAELKSQIDDYSQFLKMYGVIGYRIAVMVTCLMSLTKK